MRNSTRQSASTIAAGILLLDAATEPTSGLQREAKTAGSLGLRDADVHRRRKGALCLAADSIGAPAAHGTDAKP
jgi:hypothetical protein